MVVNALLLLCKSLTIAAIAKLSLLVGIAHISKSPSAIVNDLVGTLNQVEQLCIHLQLLIALVFMAFLPLAIGIFDVRWEEFRIQSVHNLEVGEMIDVCLNTYIEEVLPVWNLL